LIAFVTFIVAIIGVLWIVSSKPGVTVQKTLSISGSPNTKVSLAKQETDAQRKAEEARLKAEKEATAHRKTQVRKMLKIGDQYGGGKIAWIDGTGKHGLIAAKEDSQGLYSFLYEAEKSCNDLEENGYTDWYLPSKNELNKLYANRRILGCFGGA
jgi:hypothetical protein